MRACPESVEPILVACVGEIDRCAYATRVSCVRTLPPEHRIACCLPATLLSTDACSPKRRANVRYLGKSTEISDKVGEGTVKVGGLLIVRIEQIQCDRLGAAFCASMQHRLDEEIEDPA